MVAGLGGTLRRPHPVRVVQEVPAEDLLDALGAVTAPFQEADQLPELVHSAQVEHEGERVAALPAAPTPASRRRATCSARCAR